jgi:hypothetical protein
MFEMQGRTIEAGMSGVGAAIRNVRAVAEFLSAVHGIGGWKNGIELFCHQSCHSCHSSSTASKTVSAVSKRLWRRCSIRISVIFSSIA